MSDEDDFKTLRDRWAANKEADARLTALAPEMAELLKRVQRTKATFTMDAEGHEFFVLLHEITSLLDRARGETWNKLLCALLGHRSVRTPIDWTATIAFGIPLAVVSWEEPQGQISCQRCGLVLYRPPMTEPMLLVSDGEIAGACAIPRYGHTIHRERNAP